MKAARSISAVVLAALVLVSSTSFMVGMHFCMGELQNVALFTEADGCPNEQRVPTCHRPAKSPCCAEEVVIHEADDFKVSQGNIQLAPVVSIEIAQPLVLISELIPVAPRSRVNYYNYDPPLRSCDLTVEHQVFLI